mgnify:CR=1 FL=1
MKIKVKKEAIKKCINSYRLPYDARERLPVKWLTKDHDFMGTIDYYPNVLEMIKGSILCMDESHPNHHHLSDEQKEMVKKLQKYPDVVDITLCSIFQWFGTTVGRANMQEVIQDIHKIDNDGVKR